MLSRFDRCVLGMFVVPQVLLCVTAQTQEAPLHLSRAEVGDLARSRSPDMVVAAHRVDESRAQPVGAEILLRQAPWLEFNMGPRFKQNETIYDAEISLGIPLEIYGRRSAESAAASGAIARDEALTSVTRQAVLAEAFGAYYRGCAQPLRSAGLGNGWTR